MGLDKIIDHLAAYLTFCLEFWRFGGFEQLRGDTAVSPQMVTFLLAGVGLAYLIALSPARFPGYEWTLARRSSGHGSASKGHETESQDIALFALLLFVGAVTLHGWLWVTGRLLGVELHGIHRTVNATLALQAVYHPVHAILLRLGKLFDTAPFRRHAVHRRSVKIAILLLELYIGFLGMRGLLVVHEAPFGRGFPAVIVATIFSVVAALGVFMLLGWPAFMSDDGNGSRSQQPMVEGVSLVPPVADVETAGGKS